MSNKKHDEATERSAKDAEIITVLPEDWLQDFKKGPNNEFSLDWGIRMRPDSKATIYLLDHKEYNIVEPIQNFFLTNIGYGKQERVQTMETFAGVDLTFLGERPVQVSLNLELYNTDNKNWRDQWIYLWDNHLRGTIAARNQHRVVVAADNLMMEGSFITYNFQEGGVKQTSVGISVIMICPPEMIGPIKLFENITLGPENTDSIRGDILLTLNSGDKNAYYANSK